ncbi:MAG: 3-dehydroquinate synthase [Bacteroidales bacterium]|nr:3-dehydroquinate synthase [Bacteroidales bacterium]
MTTIEIQGTTGRSQILTGESLSNFRKYIPVSRTIIITDNVVQNLYGHFWHDLPVVIIGQGEVNKTLETVQLIIAKLFELDADRNTFILGVGGGIVCDVTGFVASVFMRGVRFGFISTTLLSQVDASVGGKNGVNFNGFKNIIGVFNQPEFVICDPVVLKTLDRNEISNGLAEIAKHALLADAVLFDFIEQNAEAVMSLREEVIGHLVIRSVEIKSAIVNRDEKETDERRKLNFGHTFGHAIEKIAGISHGKAVSIGMVIAARFSKDKGYLSENDLERIVNLLTKLELPLSQPLQPDLIFRALEKDKKRADNAIHFVLLKSIGEAVVEELPLSIIRKIKI